MKYCKCVIFPTTFISQIFYFGIFCEFLNSPVIRPAVCKACGINLVFISENLELPRQSMCTPQTLYNTIVGIQDNFCVNYPILVIMSESKMYRHNACNIAKIV